MIRHLVKSAAMLCIALSLNSNIAYAKTYNTLEDAYLEIYDEAYSSDRKLSEFSGLTVGVSDIEISGEYSIDTTALEKLINNIHLDDKHNYKYLDYWFNASKYIVSRSKTNIEFMVVSRETVEESEYVVNWAREQIRNNCKRSI